MISWDQWKKGFDKWESNTAERLERWLRSPAVLTPGGALLSAALRLKATRDASIEFVLSSMRLPTRTEQERTLYELQRLRSQVMDLQELIEDLEERRK
ncbi:MAG: poly(R)-hydroxyalkanoic acid synthase subunit PhaE [Deltaproteobacteria bacterium]|nr:poly(R)-hydroxyalkanoic acid synthase subunit PhaE [Deltaproteobacteria bacterium]